MIDWEHVGWEEFESTLQQYRDKFYLGRYRREEQAYLSVIQATDGLAIVERADLAPKIVTFLNTWKCRFKRAASEPAISAWIRANAVLLEGLADLRIDDHRMLDRLQVMGELHESLIALKRLIPPNGIHNMSDACASKVLHVMNPSLFVMWDNNIRGSLNFEGFSKTMHSFAIRLRDAVAPAEARPDVGAYLSARLAYPVRKSLAKYIDEYNWYLAFGQQR